MLTATSEGQVEGTVYMFEQQIETLFVILKSVFSYNNEFEKQVCILIGCKHFPFSCTRVLLNLYLWKNVSINIQNHLVHRCYWSIKGNGKLIYFM